MRNLVVVFFLIQSSFVLCGSRPSFVTDAMVNIAESVVNECKNQTGVAKEDIEAVRNGTWSNSRPLKCYMYCLWVQFGLVDENDELSINGMLTFFQRMPAYRNEVSIALRECNGLGKYMAHGDNCTYAYTFNMCYAILSPRTYYLF